MKRKTKPMMYLDTHAGSGLYSHLSPEASKNKEYASGIDRVSAIDDLPPLLKRYSELVEQCREENTTKSYPGSPWIAKNQLQATDCLYFYELHNTEFALLENNFSAFKSCHTFHADGLNGFVASMPPVQRRALVLIDPSYELKEDYDRVVSCIVNAHKRFTSGTILLWYPLVDRERINRLENRLKNSGIRNISLYELGVAPDSSAIGMTGSGVIVINQAWNLFKEMQTELPVLKSLLTRNGQGSFRCETLVNE